MIFVDGEVVIVIGMLPGSSLHSSMSTGMVLPCSSFHPGSRLHWVSQPLVLP